MNNRTGEESRKKDDQAPMDRIVQNRHELAINVTEENERDQQASRMQYDGEGVSCKDDQTVKLALLTE